MDNIDIMLEVYDKVFDSNIEIAESYMTSMSIEKADSKDNINEFNNIRDALLKCLKLNIYVRNLKDKSYYIISRLIHNLIFMNIDADKNYDFFLDSYYEEVKLEKECLLVLKEAIEQTNVNNRKGLADIYLITETLAILREKRVVNLKKHEQIYRNSLNHISLTYNDTNDISNNIPYIKASINYLSK